MNKYTAMVVIAALATLSALLVYYFEPASDTDPDQALSADERRGLTLLKTAQDICLAGQSQTGGLDMNLSLKLKEKLSASAQAKKEKAKGAVNFLDENLRLIENEKIRDCLLEYTPQIRACLMGDCGSASLPKDIEFQFTYALAQPDPNLFDNLVAFGLQNRIDNRILILQPGKNYYVDSVELMPAGEQRQAALYNVVREGHATAYDQSTRLCLSRAEPIKADNSSHTRYHCKQGEGCTHDPLSPQWFALCDGSAHASLTDWLISPAQADAAKSSWVIPSLTTLQSREDLFGIGYTHFRLQSLAPLHIQADGYYFDLAVNGWQTQINGLPGSFNAKSHDFRQPLDIEFGLQNLNFAGVRDGCDNIALSLHFVQGGKEVGQPIELSRSYVALRDARIKNITADGVGFRWSGEYRRAPREYDTEVFVSSILVARGLDLAGNAQGIARAKREISSMKTEFDRLQLQFEGRPLVAVIRPPLTQISYGLAIGIVEPTQQIRFTYDQQTATRLRQFLLQQRARGGDYQRVIKPDTFLYSVRGDESYMASPPVCWDD